MTINHLQIVNDFFRDKDMTDPELIILQNNYRKELEALLATGGCSKCKKNSLRRRFKKLILDKLQSVEEDES